MNFTISRYAVKVPNLRAILCGAVCLHYIVAGHTASLSGSIIKEFCNFLL